MSDNRTAGTRNQEVAFTVQGNPIPKARPVTRFRDDEPVRTFTPRPTADWEYQVAWAAREAMRDRAPIEGPIGVWMYFHRQTARACDVDNLAKAVLDAIQEQLPDVPDGIVFKDDSQIVELHLFKNVNPANPRVEVRVWPIPQGG